MKIELTWRMDEVILFVLKDDSSYQKWNRYCEEFNRPDLMLDWGDFGEVEISLLRLFRKGAELKQLAIRANKQLEPIYTLLETGEVKIVLENAEV